MRIIINMSNRLGGGSFQVAVSFAMDLLSRQDGNSYYFVCNREVLRTLAQLGAAVNGPRFFYVSNRFYALLHVQLGRLEKKVHPDLVFTLFGPAYWRPRTKHLVGFANPYYLDMRGPFLKRLSPSEILMLKLKRALHTALMRHEADAIVTETEYCTKGYLRLFKGVEKGFTVGNTYSQFFSSYIGRPKRSHTEFTVVTVCKYYRHKNLEVINDVIGCLRRMDVHDVDFIVTMDKRNYERIFGKNEYIMNAGALAPQMCPEIYPKADAMLLPSLAECFSASYPEAMIMKTPIITSDLPFAHSICADAAVYVDTLNPQAVANAILMLKNSAELRSRLIENGLSRVSGFGSSKDRTRKYIECCRQLYGDSSARPSAL